MASKAGVERVITGQASIVFLRNVKQDELGPKLDPQVAQELERRRIKLQRKLADLPCNRKVYAVPSPMPKPPDYGASTLGEGYNLQRELMKKHQQRKSMKKLSSTAVQTIIICICMMHNAAPVNPAIIDQNFYTGIVEQQHKYISGMITHNADTQKVELAKINQELIQTTFVTQFETNELEANQAEVADNIRKMEIRLDAHELELRVFKRATSDAKIAAEHNSHGDVIIDAVYQQELDIRDAEYRELMNTTKEFYKTLYEKEQVI